MIDFSGKVPIYLEIVYFYKNLIDRGVISSNDELPTIDEIALNEKISKNEVEKAFAMLVNDAYFSLDYDNHYSVIDKKRNASRRKRLKEKLQALIEEGYQIKDMKACIKELETEHD